MVRQQSIFLPGDKIKLYMKFENRCIRGRSSKQGYKVGDEFTKMSGLVVGLLQTVIGLYVLLKCNLEFSE